MRLIKLAALILCGAMVKTTSAAAEEKFETFADFRNRLLDLIGGAQKQVFLTTDFLTDGETVTALYLAKYRGINVKVFLGAGKADSYMSRLNYLKNQNIPTYFTPHNFPLQKGTVLVTDNNMITSGNSLDYRTNATTFRLESPNEKVTLSLLKAYQDAFESPNPVKARPIPLVGKPSIPQTPLPPLAAPAIPSQPQAMTEDGYNYDRTRAGKSSTDVPKHLPNKTKYQIKQMKQVQEATQAN